MNRNEKAEETAALLVAQMKRAISILESEEGAKKYIEVISPSWMRQVVGERMTIENPVCPELFSKLREIRRDSIRLEKEIKKGEKYS